MTGSHIVIYSLVFLLISVFFYTFFGRFIVLDRLTQLGIFRKHWSRQRTVYTLVIFIAIFLIILNYLFDLPIKLLFILTVLNLVVRENYPFSHYPMYATFSKYSNFVYITDQEDKPIPMLKVFGLKSNFIKKIYMDEVMKISAKKNKEPWDLSVSDLNKPGQTALVYLISNVNLSEVAKSFRSIKLYDTTIYLSEGKVQKNRRLVCERILK
jgi:hypothetical protein